MAILSGDIKLVESQIMSDAPESGGAPTANVIQDGASNNLFPDISELDRAGGVVNMRKVHVHVQTDNRDTYMGANMIVAEPPNDPNVSITLFSTNQTFDRRTDARDRVESYLTTGPLWSGYLLENHVIGQRTLSIFQRVGTPMPNIGRTLVLVQNEGLSTEYSQFVRVIRTERETRTFSEFVNGSYIDFPADVVTCEISDGLRFDFPGSPASRGFGPAANKSKLRDTTVADAANYYGASTLTTAADLGDQSVSLADVYTQLVPSARTEVPTLDEKPGAQRTIDLATTPRQVTVGVSPHTMRIKIGQENRGATYVQLLRPFPAPNSITISYRALGDWYTLTDDGLGNLSGNGTGTINYATGSIALTLAAFPDVGSSIIFSWGESTSYTNRSAALTFEVPMVTLQLQHKTIKAGTFNVSWTSGGVAKSATANATGVISGDATGEINYAAGAARMRPAAMPDPGSNYVITYDYATTITESFSNPAVDAAGFGSFVLSQTPAPGSIRVRWITARTVSLSSGATTGENTDKTTKSGQTYYVAPGTADVGWLKSTYAP
jgi:hypothetical protein